MFKQYRKLQANEFILCAVDTSAGGNDYTAAQFLSKNKVDAPVVIHTKQTITAVTPQLHQKLEEIFDITGVQPVVAYETNNGGIFEMERLAALNRLNKYRMYYQRRYGKAHTEITDKIGFTTTTATRPAMLSDLKNAIDHKLIKLYHQPTVQELFTFIIGNNGKPQAEDNSHDDLVMSLAIAWQMYQTEEPPKKANYQIDDLPENDLFQGGFY